MSELVDQYHSYRDCPECGRYCEALVADYGDFLEPECLSCGFSWVELPADLDLPAGH